MLGALGSIPAAQAQMTPTSTTVATTATTVAVAPTTTTTAKSRATTTVAPATTSTSAATTTTFPPGLLAIANSVKRSPPSNDAALLAALAPLVKLGFTTEQAEIVGMGQFPVAGPAYYTDDWLEPRPGPIPKLHQGDDVVAAMGTPIRSPIDGVLKYDTSDPTGYGLDAVVTGPDKTFYLMAHMSATVAGLATGAAVKQGQVIGFVGQSGFATGPHVHFEVHPLGGAGVDPKPILDGWQAAAIAAVPALISAINASTTSTVVTVPPLAIALPAPQVAFSPPLASATPIPKPSPGSLAGPALVGLVALLASCSLAAARFRPWPGGAPTAPSR